MWDMEVIFPCEVGNVRLRSSFPEVVNTPLLVYKEPSVGQLSVANQLHTVK